MTGFWHKVDMLADHKLLEGMMKKQMLGAPIQAQTKALSSKVKASLGKSSPGGS